MLRIPNSGQLPVTTSTLLVIVQETMETEETKEEGEEKKDKEKTTLSGGKQQYIPFIFAFSACVELYSNFLVGMKLKFLHKKFTWLNTVQ
jgi:hypothetical protein